MHVYTIILRGILLLFMGLGIARFAFTPVLPLMQVRFGLPVLSAASLILVGGITV